MKDVKRYVFRARLKLSVDVDSLTWRGSIFQRIGAFTANARYLIWCFHEIMTNKDLPALDR